MKSKKPYNQIVVLGEGERCTNCDILMERRKHKEINPRKMFFYTKWDYCQKCNRVKHYDDFKNEIWKESERQKNFITNL